TAGKTTLAVVLGRNGTRAWYLFLLAVAFAAAGTTAAIANAPLVVLIVLSVPAALPPVRAILDDVRGAALNPMLKATARFHLVFGVLFAIGLALA
ncbi:MAG: hypothetical protein ACM3S1_17040, partial [Hyphomicrobiales bacterium]